MIRTDIHRPSAIKPHEYTFVAHDYFGPAGLDPLLMRERLHFREHMKRTGGKLSNHEHGGSCHICGASALYVARFYHPSTNSYITTGEDCAMKMAMGDADAFRRFRAAMGKARVAEAGKRKAEKTLADAGLGKAWEIYAAEDRSAFRYEENTISDIVSKLVRYGSVSEKALNFVGALLAKIPERAKVEAARAAEAEAALPIPAALANGRAKIVGEVLSVKEKETRFGLVHKMLVKNEAGWKVWGTVPAVLSFVERGDIVEFEAVVTVSENDPKFGFFARPTKARMIREGGNENDKAA